VCGLGIDYPISVKPEEKDEFTYADAATTLRYGDQILVVGKGPPRRTLRR